MKSHAAASVAAILLLASSAPGIAAELPFNAPHTVRAQESAALLHRAAHALYDSSGGGGGISDLWLFPTADANTVFAEYTLKTSGPSASSTDHLVVLTLRGDRTLKIRDLTDDVTEAGREGRDPG